MDEAELTMDDTSPSTVTVEDDLSNFDSDPFFTNLFSDLDNSEPSSEASDSEDVLRGLQTPPMAGDRALSPLQGLLLDENLLRYHNSTNYGDVETKTEFNRTKTVDVIFTPKYELPGKLLPLQRNPQDDTTSLKSEEHGCEEQRAEDILDVPTIEQSLAFYTALDGRTWEPKVEQLRVFCDYIRASTVHAKRHNQRLKKGDTISRGLMLSFGEEALYTRGGGVRPGSSSDIISKLFHFISGSSRVKRKRKRGRDDSELDVDMKSDAHAPAAKKLVPILPRPAVPVLLPGGRFIPPALIFVAAPILFVCFVAYGHSLDDTKFLNHQAASKESANRHLSGAPDYFVGPPALSVLERTKLAKKVQLPSPNEPPPHHASRSKSRVGKARPPKTPGPKSMLDSIKFSHSSNGGDGPRSPLQNYRSGTAITKKSSRMKAAASAAAAIAQMTSLVKEPKSSLRRIHKKTKHPSDWPGGRTAVSQGLVLPVILATGGAATGGGHHLRGSTGATGAQHHKTPALAAA